MKRKLAIFSLLVALSFGLTSVAFAEIGGDTGAGGTVGGDTGSGGTIGGDTGSGGTIGGNTGEPGVVDTVGDVMTVLENLTNWMFTIFMALAVIMVIAAAFTYLTSGGIGAKKDSPAAVSQAHKMLLYSAVAIAVAVLAKGFVNVIRILFETGT